MKVLVTGGAGFIGHHLVRQLLEAGDAVVVLDNLSRGSFEDLELASAELIFGDIRDADACARAVAGCDSVVHLAAQSNVMGSEADPELTVSTNVEGTRTIATAARSGCVSHFIFASSREVYGDPLRLPVAESDPLRAKNAYGTSKVAAEALLREIAADRFAVSILRFANVIGPGDSGRVLPLWLAAARERQPLVLYGGRQVIDFVPVATAVEAIARLVHGGPVTGPINIGSGKQTSLLDVASAIREVFGWETIIEVQPAREVEVSRFQADVTRMRKLLGIEPPDYPLAVIREVAEAIR